MVSKMAKKASLELSMNYLVWLILGLLMFILGIFLLSEIFTEIDSLNGFF